MVKMKCLGFVLCALFVARKCNAEKLNIEVLYESLCPDSIRFVGNQLTPNYNEIAEFVNITFVPFGKAYSDQDKHFECQHGPTECQGNRVQSCVLHIASDQERRVQYVDCFMKSFIDNPVEYGRNCAIQAGVPWEVVKQCVESNMGTSLQLHAEEVTRQYSPSFIPTIVYNKQFDQEAQDNSIVGFRNYVCNRLRKTHANACPVMSLKQI